jgi:L-alanine-DL-glutamate epimerase-like enolase superfamily enzyme
LTIDETRTCRISMVEITRIEVRAIAPEVDRFRYTARSRDVFTTTTLVRISDGSGAIGVAAYDSDSFGSWDLSPLETLRTIVPRLIGIDAGDRELVRSIVTEDGTSPFAPAARSAIDIALWDLSARRTGHPLREELGGRADATTLPAYASLALHEDEDAYLGSIAQLVATGFTAVKLHAWGDPERDAGLLHAVRRRFPGLTLMHDAEGRYERAGAETVARACSEVGARWFEAPLPDLDLGGYRWLRGRVPGLPVLAAGDALWDARLIAEVLRDPPWDALRFDVSFAGGPTAAGDLMRVAADAGLDVELISYGHTLIQSVNLHVALAFDRTSFFEQAVPPQPFEHGVVNPIRTDPTGTVRSPDGPGLGIDLDDRALEDATIGSVDTGA